MILALSIIVTVLTGVYNAILFIAGDIWVNEHYQILKPLGFLFGGLLFILLWYMKENRVIPKFYDEVFHLYFKRTC